MNSREVWVNEYADGSLGQVAHRSPELGSNYCIDKDKPVRQVLFREVIKIEFSENDQSEFERTARWWIKSIDAKEMFGTLDHPGKMNFELAFAEGMKFGVRYSESKRLNSVE
jgi:hypothetical protein